MCAQILNLTGPAKPLRCKGFGPERPHQRRPRESRDWDGHGRRKRLQTRGNGTEKTEPLPTQRLAVRKPRNPLEKTKPLPPLDLRRNCRPSGRVVGRKPWAGEETQPTRQEQVTTKSQASFRGKRGLEKITKPPGPLPVSPFAQRACDTKDKGLGP